VDGDTELNNDNQNYFILLGYAAQTAASIIQARSIIRKAEPDIIVMETVLPDGDGFLFCRELCSKTNASVIFLTHKSNDEDLVKGMETGANDYIKKPFQREILSVRVDAVMRRRNIRGKALW
jgi:DNA-binding response OmpR family regulator